MEERASKYSINVVRELLVFGEPPYEALVKKLLKAYEFVHVRAASEKAIDRGEISFVLAVVDFAQGRQVQAAVKLFTEQTSELAVKLVYATNPDKLPVEILLLLQEVGARQVFVGAQRNDELKDYVKRFCLERHQVGSVEAYEAEIEQAHRKGDTETLKRTIAKLRELPQAEDVLRVTAVAALYANDLRRAEVCLRQVLTVNPQNLWAANTLGKLYLKTGRGALGVETLKKLSVFHELNSERLLTLGNAALLAGDDALAEDALKKGDKLNAGGDGRFHEGLAKVKLAQHDVQAALTLVAGRGFSMDVISFLNMRAILAMRSGRFDEGMSYYEHALEGAGQDNGLKARIKFNVGLGYTRVGDVKRAEAAFHESQKLGGPAFQRAKGPLEILARVQKSRGKDVKLTDAEMAEMTGGGADWETLY